MDRSMNDETKPKFLSKKWIRNMGIGVFLFFLIKGLIWLAVFFGLFKFVSC